MVPLQQLALVAAVVVVDLMVERPQLAAQVLAATMAVAVAVLAAPALPVVMALLARFALSGVNLGLSRQQTPATYECVGSYY